MNYREHKTGGICAGVAMSAMLFADNPNLLSLVSSAILITGASIGCVLPDIDSATSKISKKPLFKPLSKVIRKRFGHRGATHSLILSLLILSLLICSSYMFRGVAFFIYSNFIIGLACGYLSHLFLDFITIEGIPLFYPFYNKKYHIAKFKGSEHETIVTALCLVLTGFYIYLKVR